MADLKEALAQVKNQNDAKTVAEFEELKRTHDKTEWSMFRMYQVIRSFGNGTFVASQIAEQTAIPRPDVLTFLNRIRVAGAIEIVAAKAIHSRFDEAETQYRAVDLSKVVFHPLKRPEPASTETPVLYGAQEVLSVLRTLANIGEVFTAEAIDAKTKNASQKSVRNSIYRLNKHGFIERVGSEKGKAAIYRVIADLPDAIPSDNATVTKPRRTIGALASNAPTTDSAKIVEYLRNLPSDATFSSTDIAEAIGVSRGSASGKISQMMKAGNIEKAGEKRMPGAIRPRFLYKVVDLSTVSVFERGDFQGSRPRARTEKQLPLQEPAPIPEPAPAPATEPEQKPASEPKPKSKATGSQFLVKVEGFYVVGKIAVREVDGELKVVWLDHHNEQIALVGDEEKITRLPE
jgi:hypothetical protein